ncbi:MAG: squalene/phytoene synthase family protein [Sediminibacterium sp.]|nr:squalene/phytoene synthase family protein [Sediminibacterium sp.]
MKTMFDELSVQCSKLTTKKYSTSFSLGILFLNKKIRNPIYAIYGLVRFADEIVDSFHDYNKAHLLQQFKLETFNAIKNKISLNPILNAFQQVVHQYQIEQDLITSFFKSMEFDLVEQENSLHFYKEYIYGSAEVVGLMCLHVFTNGNKEQFESLKPYAMKLGAAFQKVNFLRDIKTDYESLHRTYFPNIDINHLNSEQKKQIENDIEQDFTEALIGIKMLPKYSIKGVYLAYYYYYVLFKKIKKMPYQTLFQERVRISNSQKFCLLLKSNIKLHFNLF